MNASALPRRNNPALKRARILEEAIQLLAEEGFYRFTVEELARRSAVSKGGLLHHFRTKEDLFVAVLEEYEQRLGQALGSVVASLAGEPREGATRTTALALLRGMVEHSAAEPELMRLFAVIQAEALQASHPAHDYFAGLQDRIATGIGRIVQGLTAEPDAVAREIYAAMMGLEYQWLRTGGGFDYLAAWDRVAGKLLPEGNREGAG